MKCLAALAVAFVASATAVSAQEIVWEIVNEYPATSLPGEADAFFVEAVKQKTGGRILIRPVPDAKSGLRSRDHLKAVADGRFAMANSFAGALGDESPVFLLSSLPFVTSSAGDARRLYDAARPLYERLFAERGQRLLYVVPWPPSGIWSAQPITSRDALKTLKIRAYDKTGIDLFSQLSASAAVISFADLNPKLESGEINAVLSSGDGGAGRQLWRYLRQFSDIQYAVPLSFASVSLDAWNKLDANARGAVDEAARETSERQWGVMADRVTRNFARMRENGVAIEEHPPAEVIEALRSAAGPSIVEWQSRSGSQAREILEIYRQPAR